jgi:hypothetical protein
LTCLFTLLSAREGKCNHVRITQIACAGPTLYGS